MLSYIHLVVISIFISSCVLFSDKTERYPADRDIELPRYFGDFEPWSRCGEEIGPNEILVVLPENEDLENLIYLDKFENSHTVFPNAKRCAKLPNVPGRLIKDSTVVFRIYGLEKIVPIDKWEFFGGEEGFLEICQMDGLKDPVVRVMSEKFKERSCEKIVDAFERSRLPGPNFDDFYRFNREFVGAGITDLKAFRGLNFSFLDLSENKIISLQGIEKMDQLADLRLTNNPVVFTEYFPPNLEALFLNGTQIGSLEKLSLFKLQRLELNRTPALKSIEGIQRLPNLRIVQVVDSPSLENCAAVFTSGSIVTVTGSGTRCIAREAERVPSKVLEDLILDGSNIQNFKWVDKHPRIDHLSLRNNQIATFPVLEHPHQLRSLDLRGNDLKNADGVHIFPDLRHLDLGANLLKDPDALRVLKNLEYLFLAQNQLEDAGALARIPTLKNLSLAFNRIRNVQFAESLVNLDTLNIEGNQISDLKPLAGLQKLGNQLLNLVTRGNPVRAGGCPTDQGPEILRRRCAEIQEQLISEK